MDRYDVRWNRSRDLEVVIDIERERVFTKVGF
jgi:hypothetical protein